MNVFIQIANYAGRRGQGNLDAHPTPHARTFREKDPEQKQNCYLKMSAKRSEAKQQFKVEVKAVLNRWFDESDLDVEDLSACAVEAIEEWLDEDIIEFTPE